MVTCIIQPPLYYSNISMSQNLCHYCMYKSDLIMQPTCLLCITSANAFPCTCFYIGFLFTCILHVKLVFVEWAWHIRAPRNLLQSCISLQPCVKISSYSQCIFLYPAKYRAPLMKQNVPRISWVSGLLLACNSRFAESASA